MDLGRVVSQSVVFVAVGVMTGGAHAAQEPAIRAQPPIAAQTVTLPSGATPNGASRTLGGASGSPLTTVSPSDFLSEPWAAAGAGLLALVFMAARRRPTDRD